MHLIKYLSSVSPSGVVHLLEANLPSIPTNEPFLTHSPANSACLSQISILNQSVTSSFAFESHLLTATENVTLTFPESKYYISGAWPTLPTTTTEFTI